MRWLLILFLPLAASAQSGAIGGQYYLVDGKVITGFSGGFQGDILGLDLELDLIYTSEEDTSGATDGHFIGTLLAGHLMGRVPVDLGPVMLRGGTGLDAFALWGINADEWKFGWPLLAEARAQVIGPWEVFLRARYYLVRSDGLGVGEAFDGEEGAPFLLSVGVGGRWGI